MKSLSKNVMAGILPAVEGGILPPGPMPDFSRVSEFSRFFPPGWKPGSTAGVDARRYGKFRKTLVAAVALAALAPSPLFACAACYGQSDSPLASGMNWGIFTLLGVILTVLTCFALFFVHVVRGEKAQDNNNNDPASKNPPGV